MCIVSPAVLIVFGSNLIFFISIIVDSAVINTSRVQQNYSFIYILLKRDNIDLIVIKMMISMILLLVIGVLVLFTWIWSRREKYILSWKLNGPIGLPIIGNILDFRNQEGIKRLDIVLSDLVNNFVF